MKRDKYGIYVPDHTKIPLGNDRAENTTRIYTTKNDQPMVKSEVEQCIKLYEKEMGVKPTVIIIPQTLKDFAKEIQTNFNLFVKLGAARHNQITLTQQQ